PQIVTAHMFPTINDELRARRVGTNIRRAPSCGVIARGAPDLFPIGKVESRDKSVGQHVALHEDTITVNDGGTGKSPFEIHAFGVQRVVVNHWTGPQNS